MSHEIESLLNNAMTVRDLIADLRNFDPDAIVLVVSDYGDITHTMQVQAVDTIDEMEPGSEALYESAYSKSGVALREDEDGDLDEDEAPAVVLLRI